MMYQSRYKDKQITELSNSQSSFFLHEQDGGDDRGSFDFNPIPSGTHLRGWSSVDRAGILCDEDLISAIDQKMKEHADVLLHSVQCLGARVSQMESRTRRLENTLDDLKELIESNHDDTGRKLTELENVLMEVQGVIKDIRDKQEITEAQLMLSKLSTSNANLQVEEENNFQATSTKEASSSASMLSHQLLPVSAPHPQQYNVTNVPPQNYPPTSPQAPSPPFPTAAAATVAATAPPLPSLSQSYHLPVASPATANQHFNVHAAQLPQPTPETHQQPFQPLLALSPQLTQLPPAQPPFAMANPQVQYALYHPPEVPYPPSHPHGIKKPTWPPGGSLPPVQLNLSSIQQVHDQPHSKSHPESQAQWWQPLGQANTTDPYQYGGSLAWDGSPTMKTLQALTSHSTPRPVEDNPLLTQATRALPHAIPTASIIDAEASSGGTRTKVPVDNVVDKVVAMGFRRDLVRATVKKLTEKGQPVDLNVVLDKLMNNG